MKIQKIIVTLIAVSISSMVLMAATSSNEAVSLELTLTGTVVDAEMMEGIEGAEVTLEETEQSATTDETGTFTFSELEEGTYTVSVTAEDYKTATQEVEVTEEGATIEIQLEPETE